MRRPVVAHGVGLDGACAVGLLGDGDLGLRVVLGLQLRAVVGDPVGGLGRVDAHRVLAGDAAVGADERELTGLVTHLVDRLGDAVHRVVVAQAAEERQSAGESEATRVVGGQPCAVADVEHREREAAVQIEGRHVVQADTGHAQRLVHRGHRGRAGTDVGALQQLGLLHVGVPAQVHPLLFGHTEFACGFHRHHQQRGTLVHLVARDHQTRVGVDDHAIRCSDGEQFLDRALRRRRRIRVLGGHFRERGKQLGHREAIVGNREAQAGAAGVLQKAVLHRGTDQAVADRVLVEDSVVPVAAVLQLPVDGLGVVRLVLGLGEVAQRGGVLRAEDQHDVVLTGRDLAAELRREVLRALPADHLEHGMGRVGADVARDRARVVAGDAERGRCRAGDLELPGTCHGVDGARHGIRVGPAVMQGGLRGLGRQLDRRHAPITVEIDAFGELSHADDDRRTRIDHVQPP
ncbi:Uncharacterised protein [Mycolicibacterium smegmatis]|nr:Uncharacterised protein [Mycolicibacterium smegmatis]